MNKILALFLLVIFLIQDSYSGRTELWSSPFQLSDHGATSIEAEATNSNTSLLVWPNPFNPKVNIKLPINLVGRNSKLEILSAHGKVIKTIIFNDYLVSQYSWIPSNHSSGLYIVRFVSKDKVFTKKVLLLK